MASWIIKKSNSASYEARDNSLVSTLSEANLVSGCETISALYRAKLYLSREAKAKAPLGASSEATVAMLTSSTLLSNIREALSHEAKAEVPLGAISEATTASFKSRAQLSSARLTSSSRTKALSAHTAPPREAKPCGEPI